MKTLYGIGDVVNAKFQYAGGEFNGAVRIVDEVYGVEWNEKQRRYVKSSKLIKVRPPAFEVLSGSDNLPEGHRICGTWADITGMHEG